MSTRSTPPAAWLAIAVLLAALYPSRLAHGQGAPAPATPGVRAPSFATPGVVPPSRVPAGGKTAPPSLVTAPVDRDQPAFYQADQGEYDRVSGIVTLSGHVEFWQNDRVLLADRVTYDRTSNVAAASGHVVLMEPGGQTLFSDYAELSGGLKDGVMAGMRALLPEGGRMVANGARRTDANINELSRVVYSTCDLCADDPTQAPLWQIRATEAVQDRDNKRMEYRDAVVDFFGVPIAWFPYLTHPDPTERRASGLLAPTIGYSKHLGAYVGLPYYWAIDAQSDLQVEPLVGSNNGPAVDLAYRRRFNSGFLSIDTSLANDRSDLGGHLFAKGQFSIDDVWRWGFDINRASSSTYLRDFKVHNWSDILTSSVYLEGFGQGAYTRLDARAYQGLTGSTTSSEIPSVLPRYTYSLMTPVPTLGGRVAVDFDAFNVLRTVGTNTQRVHLSAGWDRPFIGAAGDVWKTTLHVDSAVYQAQRFDDQPNYGLRSNVSAGQAMPTAAVELRWPLTRAVGDGYQLLEPIAQVIAAPRGSAYARGVTLIPNEDSLDLDFTDATLFALNRYPGVDRLEGGMRANLALHGAWHFPTAGVVDAQIGQAYRAVPDPGLGQGSGLANTVSDVVGHVSYTPNAFFDLTTRERFDHRSGQIRFADAIASTGGDPLRVNAGYIYTFNNPYLLYDSATPPPALASPRNEVSLGVSTKQARWQFSANARQDVRTRQMVAVGLGAAYEDECFTFDATAFRRYTSINGDHGATTILFQVTLKTVGEFGFNAH